MRNKEPVYRIASETALSIWCSFILSDIRETRTDEFQIKIYLMRLRFSLQQLLIYFSASAMNSLKRCILLSLLLLLPTLQTYYDSRTYQPCYASLSQLIKWLMNAASVFRKMRCLKSKTCDMTFFSNWIRAGKLEYSGGQHHPFFFPQN